MSARRATAEDWLSITEFMDDPDAALNAEEIQDFFPEDQDSIQVKAPHKEMQSKPGLWYGLPEGGRRNG